MNISIIVAAGSNDAIGKDNQLLWHLPQDLKFFKNTTWAMPVIMGRKTFESVGGKPLPGRLNIILTTQKNYSGDPDLLAFVANKEDALELAHKAGAKEVFIAGGAQIYALFFPFANRIYMTRVHAPFEADTFFPEIDAATWKLVQEKEFKADEKHAYSFSIQCWERK
ncbi:MAG: dihydrofolate reductase [Bacteroidetes bacterium]|nr:dihydrofolate reductase [Bacteroidota bacterium]